MSLGTLGTLGTMGTNTKDFGVKFGEILHHEGVGEGVNEGVEENQYFGRFL